MRWRHFTQTLGVAKGGGGGIGFGFVGGFCYILVMRFVSWILGFAAALVGLIGCDRPASNTPPTSAPTTQPATVPAAAEFTVDGKTLRFDAPQAVFDRESVPPLLVLYSETDGPAGFYFEVPLDPESPATDIDWEVQLEQDELQDSLVGIYLTPSRQILQPQKLRILAQPASDNSLHITIEDSFFAYSGDAVTTNRKCAVSAHFRAAVVENR